MTINGRGMSKQYRNKKIQISSSSHWPWWTLWTCGPWPPEQFFSNHLVQMPSYASSTHSFLTCLLQVSHASLSRAPSLALARSRSVSSFIFSSALRCTCPIQLTLLALINLTMSSCSFSQFNSALLLIRHIPCVHTRPQIRLKLSFKDTQDMLISSFQGPQDDKNYFDKN